ncbi:MAG: M48 family metalloprotease [Acidimicrobiia bacterium]
MTLTLLAAAGALVALPGLTDRFGRRLAPEEWARLCGLGLGGGLALFELAVLLRAAPPLLRAVGVPGLAAACSRVIGPLLAGGPTVTWAAGVAAVAVPARIGMAWWRAARVRRRIACDLWLGERAVIAGRDVVVLPVSRPIAVSFATTAGEEAVVVSAGLLDRLDHKQVEAVVRHEAAHLRRRHQRLLSVAAAAEGVAGWMPPVRRSARALRLAVERGADEEAAAASSGGRIDVRDSLLALAGLPPAPEVAAFADPATVAARIAALDAPPRRPGIASHALLYAPGAVAGLMAAPALVSWAGHVRTVVAMAGRCGV